MQSVSSFALIAILSSTKQISRPHQHLCESRYSDFRISPIFIHGNGFFIHTSFFIGIHAINHHNQLLVKVFSQISHPRKEIFFNYEQLWKKIIHENRFIIHESFFLLFAAVEKFHPRNRFIIHRRFFSFTGGMWKTFHPKTDLSSTRACFSFPLGCGKLEQNPSDLSAR